MPSLLHEAPLLLFRDRLDLLPSLLSQACGLSLPAYQDICTDETDHSQVVEARSDEVLLLREGAPVLGLVVESQLGCDPDKWFTWPLYHARLRAKHRCPCWLVVFTPHTDVARWARQPVPGYQPGSQFAPVVLGPDEVPRITTLDAARRAPHLAVLSAIVHGNEPGGLDVVLPALQAADELPAERVCSTTT